MSSQTFLTKFERAGATVAAAVVCLVMVAAMFYAPDWPDGPRPAASGLGAGSASTQPDLPFAPQRILGLLIIGLVSGTFGGMLGMGGGVLKMSLLLMCFGFHPGVSRFAALLSYFVVALGASYRYAQLRLILPEVVKVLIPSSIVGVILGAAIGHYLPREVLTLLLGVFLLFITVAMVGRAVRRYQVAVPVPGGAANPGNGGAVSAGSGPAPNVPRWKIALCGLPGGLVSAMLGISGGVITSPLQQVLARIPIKNAIANTLAKACVTVPVACVMIMVMGVRAGHFDLWTPILVALCLMPGSLIGSQLGPALTRRMSSLTAHAVFGAVALCMGISMLFFSR